MAGTIERSMAAETEAGRNLRAFERSGWEITHQTEEKGYVLIRLEKRESRYDLDYALAAYRQEDPGSYAEQRNLGIEINPIEVDLVTEAVRAMDVPPWWAFTEEEYCLQWSDTEDFALIAYEEPLSKHLFIDRSHSDFFVKIHGAYRYEEPEDIDLEQINKAPARYVRIFNQTSQTTEETYQFDVDKFGQPCGEQVSPANELTYEKFSGLLREEAPDYIHELCFDDNVQDFFYECVSWLPEHYPGEFDSVEVVEQIDFDDYESFSLVTHDPKLPLDHINQRLREAIAAVLSEEDYQSEEEETEDSAELNKESIEEALAVSGKGSQLHEEVSIHDFVSEEDQAIFRVKEEDLTILRIMIDDSPEETTDPYEHTFEEELSDALDRTMFCMSEACDGPTHVIFVAMPSALVPGILEEIEILKEAYWSAEAEATIVTLDPSKSSGWMGHYQFEKETHWNEAAQKETTFWSISYVPVLFFMEDSLRERWIAERGELVDGYDFDMLDQLSDDSTPH